MRPVVGVLLAAGSGRRFGAPKLLQPLANGEPLGLAAARPLVAALPHSLAVVRPGDRRLAEGLSALGLEIIEHPGAVRGMGGSLATGVRAAGDAGGWLIALADMPWIAPQTIDRLARALAEGASMVAPLHAGRRGHPVGFHARWRPSLEALHGDQGARGLLRRHPAELTLLATTDAGVLLDVDRAGDLRRRPGRSRTKTVAAGDTPNRPGRYDPFR